MSLPLLFLAIEIAAIVCNALFCVRVLASNPRLPSAQLIALILFNSICYIVLGRYDYRYWIPAPYHIEVGSWEVFLNFARNLTPGLFMMLCFIMFSDRRRFPRWLLVLFAVQMFLEVPVHWLLPGGWRFEFLVTQTIPTVLQTVFGGFAIYWILTDWRADLIETRRFTRAFVLFVIALNIVASSLLLRVVISPDIVANYYTHMVLIAFNLAIMFFVLFHTSGGDLTPYLDPAHARLLPTIPSRAVRLETEATLSKLSALLNGERVYRRPSLSLKDLANLVGLPEYRLRKIIHEELGYQNFNAFLHDYRINEACRQLRDPSMRRIPILTIALSVGYQSVNTFNRGFRDIMGMTPSAYRSLETAPAPPTLRKIIPKTE
ncbi:MAG: helix-turn-helix transcriptional regulator [Rhizomicrobium sp.]